MDSGLPFCDRALSRRLELTEGRSTAHSVDARGALQPESGAAWIDVAGALAMFDGPSSPLTQTFGLGLSGVPSDSDLETIERFFLDRGAPVFHEVSPLAGPETMAVLNRRGYEAFECTSVLVRPLSRSAVDTGSGAASGRVRVRHVEDGNAHDDRTWGEVSARGWSEVPEIEAWLVEMGPITARRRGAHRFLAEIDEVGVAAGLLSIDDDVALLAGASTVPDARRQGAQLALLDARLRFAAGRGCALAMMCALPGSGSQRNAERHGFRPVYTRIKWRLART